MNCLSGCKMSAVCLVWQTPLHKRSGSLVATFTQRPKVRICTFQTRFLKFEFLKFVQRTGCVVGMANKNWARRTVPQQQIPNLLRSISNLKPLHAWIERTLLDLHHMVRIPRMSKLTQLDDCRLVTLHGRLSWANRIVEVGHRHHMIARMWTNAVWVCIFQTRFLESTQQRSSLNRWPCVLRQL